MVTDLTGMEIANASLLDEGTAIAEAVNMAYGIQRRKKAKVAVIGDIFPQSLATLKTRCEPIEIEVLQCQENDVPWDEVFAIVGQYPDSLGKASDWTDVIAKAKEHKCLSILAADIMSLVILKPPGEMGADIVVGSTQRFGVPMGFGGPHAAYLATRDQYKRLIPGRIVGVSKDNKGRAAYRLALQTREQHIRREKATSNICTAQVLLAVMAGMYAVFHGPRRLRQIAKTIHRKTNLVLKELRQLGWVANENDFFDTIYFQVEASGASIDKLKASAEKREINLNYHYKDLVGISVDEVTSLSDVNLLLEAFAEAVNKPAPKIDVEPETEAIPVNLQRQSDFFTHPVFHRFRSETDLLRYITRLQRKDLTLADSMIPLGSCTMKLNAAAELEPVTWPEFANIHPFVPSNQVEGYQQLIGELENFLSMITGFAGISLQPNAGSQGEYAGLLAIRHYFKSKGEEQRNICLIPRLSPWNESCECCACRYESGDCQLRRAWQCRPRGLERKKLKPIATSSHRL